MKVSFGTVAVIEFDTANEYLVFDKDKKPCGWILEFTSQRPVSSARLNEIIDNRSGMDIEYGDGKIGYFSGYSIASAETIYTEGKTPITLLKFTKGVKCDDDDA